MYFSWKRATISSKQSAPPTLSKPFTTSSCAACCPCRRSPSRMRSTERTCSRGTRTCAARCARWRLVTGQCPVQRRHLAQRAAQVRVPREQVLSVLRILLGDRLQGQQAAQLDVVNGFDSVGGADCFDEMVARFQEKYIDPGQRFRREMRQHRVLHRRRDGKSAAEFI